MEPDEIRRKISELIEKNQELIDQADRDNRAMNDEEVEEYDERKKEIEQLRKTLERKEEQERNAQGITHQEGDGPSHKPETGTDDDVREDGNYEECFRKYMRHGYVDLRSEEREKLKEGHRGYSEEDLRQIPEHLREEVRATMVAKKDDLGGFTVPEDMAEEVESALKSFNGIRQSNASTLTTGTGAPLPMPTTDDTSNKGQYIQEDRGSDVAEQEVTMGEVTLEAHLGTTKSIPVSKSLLQDSFVDIGAFVGEKLGERRGRIENEKMTTGSGSNEPHGIITANSNTVSAASSSAIDEDDLKDLINGVDPAYRSTFETEFMMHDDILNEISKIKDGNGRPIFDVELETDEGGATLDNVPVTINQDMANTISSGNETVLYGATSKYMIRDVRDMELLRLEEVEALQHNVVFVGFFRNDGNLLDAGTSPIATLQH